MGSTYKKLEFLLKPLNIQGYLYDFFEKEQVLTESELNMLINSFEDADRLTRTNLIGVGICCGLNIKEVTSDYIDISMGVGITTDGDLIIAETTKYFKYIEFKPKVDYEPFLGLQIHELIAEGVETHSTVNLIKDLPDLNNYIVIAYNEHYSKDPGLCGTLGCDETGRRVYSDLKFLLIHKKNFDQLISHDTIFRTHNIWSFYDSLPELALPRVILNNLNTTSVSQIYNLYKNAIFSSNLPDKLLQSILLVLDKLDPRINFKKYGVTKQAVTDLFAAKFFMPANQMVTDIQYRHDLLGNLIETYREIKLLLLHINFDCSPNVYSFPKHLLIGMITESERLSTRHRLYYSPVVSHHDENLMHIRTLILRFYQMLAQYSIPPTNALIKITPSRSYEYTLGKRAVPYYFKTQPPLPENWNFPDTVNRLSQYHLGYFIDHVPDPLNSSHLGLEFYRIEGHLGKSFHTALETINQKKREYGLAFNVVSISIGSSLDSIDMDQYQCIFRDLQIILQAWQAEMNCLIKTGADFFGNYDYTELGVNHQVIELDKYYTVAQTIQNTANISNLKMNNASSGTSEFKTMYAAADYAMQKGSLTCHADINVVAREYVLNDVSHFDETANENVVKIYFTHPISYVTHLLAFENLINSDDFVAMVPSVFNQFQQNLNRFCYEIEKNKIYLSQMRNTYLPETEQTPATPIFGHRVLDEKYEFYVYELSKLCCYKKKIELLQREIDKRKTALFEKLILSHFVEKHPGPEHVAGVHRGGTFILVYAGGSAQDGNLVKFDFALPYLCCSDCPPETIVYQPATPPPMDPITITGQDSVCEGSSKDYITEAGMTGYIWAVSGGDITAGKETNSITVKWNTSGAQTISVNYTDGYGNTAATPKVLNVTVNPLPVPIITSDHGDNPVCEGSTHVYSTIPNMTNYAWAVSAGGTITEGGTSDSNSVTVQWVTQGDQKVCLNYANSNGCMAATETKYPVTVNISLPVSVSVSPSLNPVCNGTRITFTATPVNGGTSPSYQWKVNSMNVGTNSPVFEYTPLNHDVVTCILTSNLPCITGNPATSVPVTITVYPPLVAGSISADQTIGYNKTPAILTGIAPTGGNSPYTFQWQVSTDNKATFTTIPGATSINFQPGTLTQTTYFRLIQNSASGCGEVFTNIVKITVNPLTVPTITGLSKVCERSSGIVYTTEPGKTGYVWTVSAGGTITAGGTATSNTITVIWGFAGTQTLV